MRFVRAEHNISRLAVSLLRLREEKQLFMQFLFLHLCFWETGASSCNMWGKVIVLQVEVLLNKQQGDCSFVAMQLTVAKRFTMMQTDSRRASQPSKQSLWPSLSVHGKQSKGTLKEVASRLLKVTGIHHRCFLCSVSSSYSTAFSHLCVLFIAWTGEWRLTTELMSVREPEHASAEAPQILEVLSLAQYRCLHYCNVLFNGSLAAQTKLKSWASGFKILVLVYKVLCSLHC